MDEKPKPGYKLVNIIYNLYEEVPDDWLIKKFGEFTIEITKRFDKERSAPILSVTKHRGFVKSLDYFKKQIFSNDTSNYKMVKKGDFAYATIHLDEGSLGLLKEYDCGFISPMYTVFKADIYTVDSNFLLYLLKTERYLQKYSMMGEGTVNRRKSISFEDLSQLRIALPPLPEQQKIASILSNVDDLITKYDSIIVQTKRLKQGLMNQLLTKGIGHKKFKKLLIIPRFIDFSIPEAWKIKKLEDISEEIRDGPMGFGLHTYDYVEKGIPLLRIQNLKDLTITKEDLRFISEKKHAELQKSQIKPLDIIISKTGILGMIGIVPKDYGDANLNQALARIRVTNSENITFVALFLASKIPQWILSVVGSGRTAQVGLKLSDIKNLQIPIPRKEEQEKITTTYHTLNSKITYLESKRNNFQKIKKGLMQKLLTGQIRVKI